MLVRTSYDGRRHGVKYEYEYVALTCLIRVLYPNIIKDHIGMIGENTPRISGDFQIIEPPLLSHRVNITITWYSTQSHYPDTDRTNKCYLAMVSAIIARMLKLECDVSDANGDVVVSLVTVVKMPIFKKK